MPSNNSGWIVKELARAYPGRIGHLYSPNGQRGPYPEIPYALDNGAFAKGASWTPEPWLSLLDWAYKSKQNPQWVLVPDVVGNKEGTLRRWEEFCPVAARYGWPLAFAVQDGMVPSDVPSRADVVFVGGSTEFKLVTMANWCAHFPHVHVGRVNTYNRLVLCWRAGVYSVDGTGWFRGNKRQLAGLFTFLRETSGIETKLLWRGKGILEGKCGCKRKKT